MKLDVRGIVPGGSLPFSHSLDFSGVEFFGAAPITRPVSVEGTVENHAGALVFSAVASTVLSLLCDRCGAPFERAMTVNIETALADRVEGEESADIELLDGGLCDVDGIVTPAFFLEMDTKNLCSEDCAGLCPICGKNLNEGPCRCGKGPVPRV